MPSCGKGTVAKRLYASSFSLSVKDSREECSERRVEELLNKEELLKELRKLVEADDLDGGLVLLRDNSGKGKIIDPDNSVEMEGIWVGGFLAHFIGSGKIEDFHKGNISWIETLKALQKQANKRYHKGSPYHNVGVSLLNQSVTFFLFAFIEDTLTKGGFPEDTPATAALQGVFKIPSDYLRRLSEKTLQKAAIEREPEKAWEIVDEKQVPAELWQMEYAMQQAEIELRKFIKDRLSAADLDWWSKLIPESTKKNVQNRIEESSKTLWFEEQPLDPLDYLTFPNDYISIIKDDKCWPHFVSAFTHTAVVDGKLTGLGQIRHKIAHYRKISDRERKMFTDAIEWIKKRISQTAKATT